MSFALLWTVSPCCVKPANVAAGRILAARESENRLAAACMTSSSTESPSEPPSY